MTESNSMAKREQETTTRTKGSSNTEDERVSKASSSSTFMGKHRMLAAITNLNNQINLIQTELHELDSLGHSSLVCNELMSSVDSVPDPLLPITKGPVDDSWDRWFRGAHNSRTNKRWI